MRAFPRFRSFVLLGPFCRQQCGSAVSILVEWLGAKGRKEPLFLGDAQCPTQRVERESEKLVTE